MCMRSLGMMEGEVGCRTLLEIRTVVTRERNNNITVTLTTEMTLTHR